MSAHTRKIENGRKKQEAGRTSPILSFMFHTSCFMLQFLFSPQLLALASESSSHQHSNTSAHETGPWQVLVESNLLNVLILALALVYLGNKFIPKMIDQRKTQISKELEDAKQAKIKAEEELSTIQRKTEDIASEIEEIKSEARKTAEIIKKQIHEDTEKELEQINQKIKREISSNYDETVQTIKKSASESAIRLAEEALSKVASNHEVQKKLMEEFVSELNKPSKN